MTSNKERDLFWCLDIKDQLKLLYTWLSVLVIKWSEYYKSWWSLKVWKWFIVLYVGESNVIMTYNVERALFWWLDILDQIKLLYRWLSEVVP